MPVFRLPAVTVAAGILAASAFLTAGPSVAASPMSNAFIANVQANLDFLSKAGRLAKARASASPVVAFAADGQEDASRVDLALQEAQPNEQTSRVAAADTDVLMTGRSVAIDQPTGGSVKAANGRVAPGDADIAALAKLSGKKFDDALWFKQLDALAQLRADYQAYADDGDDPALGKLAEKELPAVEARLAALSKI